jgi:hypothetical protein
MAVPTARARQVHSPAFRCRPPVSVASGTSTLDDAADGVPLGSEAGHHDCETTSWDVARAAAPPSVPPHRIRRFDRRTRPRPRIRKSARGAGGSRLRRIAPAAAGTTAAPASADRSRQIRASCRLHQGPDAPPRDSSTHPCRSRNAAYSSAQRANAAVSGVSPAATASAGPSRRACDATIRTPGDPAGQATPVRRRLDRVPRYVPRPAVPLSGSQRPATRPAWRSSANRRSTRADQVTTSGVRQTSRPSAVHASSNWRPR